VGKQHELQVQHRGDFQNLGFPQRRLRAGVHQSRVCSSSYQNTLIPISWRLIILFLIGQQATVSTPIHVSKTMAMLSFLIVTAYTTALRISVRVAQDRLYDYFCVVVISESKDNIKPFNRVGVSACNLAI